jgi:hypothetical protein
VISKSLNPRWPAPGHLTGCEVIHCLATRREIPRQRIVTRREVYIRSVRVRPDGSTFVLLPRSRGFGSLTPVAREARTGHWRPLVEVG